MCSYEKREASFYTPGKNGKEEFNFVKYTLRFNEFLKAKIKLL